MHTRRGFDGSGRATPTRCGRGEAIKVAICDYLVPLLVEDDCCCFGNCVSGERIMTAARSASLVYLHSDFFELFE